MRAYYEIDEAMNINRRLVIQSIPIILGFLTLIPRKSYASEGKFIGSAVGKLASNWKGMTLSESFEYIDPLGARWPVPAGASVYGASIPQVFISIIGNPFSGVYTNASVIHDFYCQIRTRDYRKTHRVFYDAMQTAGVEEHTSWLMYQAVLRFGPRWKTSYMNSRCEIIDDDYDFELCSRDAVVPPLINPTIDYDELLDFIRSVETKANPHDLAMLRWQLDRLR